MAYPAEGGPRKRPGGTARAALWTCGAVLLPGIAHLRAGRRAAGAGILGCFLLLAAAAVAAVRDLRGTLSWQAWLVTQPYWVEAVSAGSVALAALWSAVVVRSWQLTRPRPAGRGTRAVGALLLALLCTVLLLPSVLVVRTALTARATLSEVFAPAEPTRDTTAAADPWRGRSRINVLLLGGDAGENRYGLRTDTMIVASVEVDSGDTLLIGLPRNLENVPFPEGTALAERYPPPAGFDDLLNEVYQTVAEEPEELAVDPRAADPAADTLKLVIGEAIGVPIDYYALVDLRGFADLIDAVGGVVVPIEEPIRYGRRGNGLLEPGERRISGKEALWYGRSRTDSDDYTRMGRQGCLLKYVAEQADPVTVLRSFQALADAAQRTLDSDVPQSHLPALVDLAERVSTARMQTLQLSPPQVDTGHPDWEEIRTLVARALRDLDDHDPPAASARPQPSPRSPGRQVGDEPVSLDRLCP
ncbi:LCP family protein [Thermobifida cellulosilytica]|uniref:LytR family transcriptional regulator n=1 Tax=Thermobifida cellulosilytica TB100 TaxID=665004 RepID=A0A147KLQ1_THECS|nr:LCP family protein [Thermobifida cellulosilytica]KUP98183.1 LytR family transcriptional regulator [Thermobifida cellulosilytica TB100]